MNEVPKDERETRKIGSTNTSFDQLRLIFDDLQRKNIVKAITTEVGKSMIGEGSAVVAQQGQTRLMIFRYQPTPVEPFDDIAPIRPDTFNIFLQTKNPQKMHVSVHVSERGVERFSVSPEYVQGDMLGFTKNSFHMFEWSRESNSESQSQAEELDARIYLLSDWVAQCYTQQAIVPLSFPCSSTGRIEIMGTV